MSFGRRVSTSSGTRRGLRTVCQGCAEGIDAGAKFNGKAIGIVALAVIALAVLANSGGKPSYSPSPAGGLVPPANAATQPSSPARAGTPAITAPVYRTGATAAQLAPEARSDQGRAIPGPVQDPAGQNQVEVASAGAPAQALAAAGPWRHATPSGVRWSLRRQDASTMLLSIDLGGGNTAGVAVAPEFQNLPMAGMMERVDFLRAEIAQGWPSQSGVFSFSRDGRLSRAAR